MGLLMFLAGLVDLIIVTFAFVGKKFLESMLGFGGLSDFILMICSFVLIGPGGDKIAFLGMLSKLKLACPHFGSCFKNISVLFVCLVRSILFVIFSIVTFEKGSASLVDRR